MRLFSILVGLCHSHNTHKFGRHGHGGRHYRQHILTQPRISEMSGHSALLSDHSKRRKMSIPIWDLKHDTVVKKVDFNTNSNLVFVNCTEVNTAHVERAHSCLIKCEKTSLFPKFGSKRGNILLKTQSLHNFCRNTCGCQVGVFGWCNRNLDQRIPENIKSEVKRPTSDEPYTYSRPSAPDLQSFTFFIAASPLNPFQSDMCQQFHMLKCAPEGNRVTGVDAKLSRNETSVPMQVAEDQKRLVRKNVNRNEVYNVPFSKPVEFLCQKNPFEMRLRGANCFPHEVRNTNGISFLTNSSCLQAPQS